MKLVVDSKIPFVRGVAEQLGEVAYIDGAAIGPADVKQADALVVRTRTLCNRELLEGSRVQFIATATIGFDHLDAAWLAQAGIGWTNCPGCNARSVAQYVEASLLQLAVHGCWSGGPLRAATAPAADFDPAVFAGLTLGIVGVGHVGQAVEAMARRLGFGEILRCAPPRAEREGSEGFLPVDIVMHAAAGFPVVHDAARHFTLCFDRMHDEVALHIIGFCRSGYVMEVIVSQSCSDDFHVLIINGIVDEPDIHRCHYFSSSSISRMSF